MIVYLDKFEVVASTAEQVFQDLMNPFKYSAFFDNTFLSVPGNEVIPEHYEFVATVKEHNKNDFILGTIDTVLPDESFKQLNFEWRFEELGNNRTQVSYRIYDDDKTPLSEHSRYWNNKTKVLITTSTVGFGTIVASNTTVIMSTASASGIIFSKPAIAAIMITVAAISAGGLINDDAFLSDPRVEYSLYPSQLPAELHGTELTLNGILADDGSPISMYECDHEPIIRGLDYSFDCVVKNSLGIEQTVTTVVQIREPIRFLNNAAMDCVSRYDALPADVTYEFPYLQNLPELSPSRLVNLKNQHVKTMDDSFDDKDYANAKKHATILLKYFNGNDIQTLSTMGNIIRDEDRQNHDNVSCAMAIHSNPFIANTSWGTLSLADDNHVLGKFETASKLASLIIDRYESGDITIEEVSYKNASIVKANALFRIVMAATDPDIDDIGRQYAKEVEEIRYQYMKAHDIEPSYDSWFGLGNLDRYVGDFDDALEKYKEAKKMARDTTEIDHEMGVLLSYDEFNQ